MSIKIGKWEVSPQSGSAGTFDIGHKLTERHTGRSKYEKMIRASFTDPNAVETAVEILQISGLAPYLSLNTSQTEIAYNVTNVVINGMSNAAKFRVSSTGKAITLVTNSGYTVSGNEGTFSSGFGELAEGAISIKVQFSSNNTTGAVTIPVLVEYWDGSTWKTGGTHNIIQSSSDADVSFIINPSVLEEYPYAGGEKSVTITSNVAYSIEVQGDTETSWVTISRNSGTATTEALKITVAAQAVGAPARSVSIKFKSSVTSSVVGTLAVNQAAGEAFAISWAQDTLTFTNDDVNTIKTNKLTANAPWNLEENI